MDGIKNGIRWTKDKIYINEKPEKIMSGAVHYFRVVPEYWRDRLLKLKEFGCNCVETYACWNLHEKSEGALDFEGWLDLGAYLDMAQELGLYAIVRPGPYMCSEWDFGGLPWWLLKYSDIQIRCSQPLFLEKITPYLEKVCEILRPRLIGNGGNVIFVQIENEYGSYGNDKAYLRWLKEFYETRGIDCGLLTSDGETEFLLKNGTLPDVLASVNYRWDSVRCLAALQKYHGDQPGAVLELWNGKQQHWGEPIIRRDIDEVATSVKTALENAELVNLYMFHGGTNFGFMNGSLDYPGRFVVQLSSYDVDAPVNEYGFRTPKYYAEQKVICEHFGKPIENTAKDPVFQSYAIEAAGQVSLSECDMPIRENFSVTV
ncbi:MAG: beta-galactosidase, partial [Clostridia bacterium]|nr:beta-galactosidase [Clostridia bacterium]